MNGHSGSRTVLDSPVLRGGSLPFDGGMLVSYLATVDCFNTLSMACLNTLRNYSKQDNYRRAVHAGLQPKFFQATCIDAGGHVLRAGSIGPRVGRRGVARGCTQLNSLRLEHVPLRRRRGRAGGAHRGVATAPCRGPITPKVHRGNKGLPPF